jgi:hypothetical protein
LGCAFVVSFGIVPAAHVEGEAFRLTRSPQAWLVWMQGCFICEDRIDDSPRSFHRVFANEQHAISMHSISQETLIGINLVRGGLLDYRKMRGLGDKFFAGSLHSGAEAKRNFLLDPGGSGKHCSIRLPKYRAEAFLSLTSTSVVVTGRHFPARIRNGTPDHRHD